MAIWPNKCLRTLVARSQDLRQTSTKIVVMEAAPTPQLTWLTDHRTTRAEARRSRPYHKRVSKLARYRSEMVALRRAGGSIREIQTWLAERRRETRSGRSPTASVSVIHAYLKSLPELRDA